MIYHAPSSLPFESVLLIRYISRYLMNRIGDFLISIGDKGVKQIIADIYNSKAFTTNSLATRYLIYNIKF